MRGIRPSRMDADSRGFGTGHGRARTCAESDCHGWTRTIADSEPVTDEHEHARISDVSRMDADSRGFGTGHGRARTCAESDRHGWARTVADSETSRTGKRDESVGAAVRLICGLRRLRRHVGPASRRSREGDDGGHPPVIAGRCSRVPERANHPAIRPESFRHPPRSCG